MQVIDWQKIVKKHGPTVWQAAYRLLGNDADAADCFQETFVSALKVSRKQRVRNIRALLLRLVTMRAIDKLRQRFAHSQISIESAVLAAMPSANPGPLQEVQKHELAEILRMALAKLPQQEAHVFCLRYLNNMSYRQIAKELGIKTNAAGVLLHRAREKLRKFFEV